eukprot:GHVN01091391.1.p1 GENE.GHVN01091391.1~~GHVN01091391.1.p1  ORF type:complete len:392 (-),score=149.34 GHVN01091391.1:33-1208(-)
MDSTQCLKQLGREISKLRRSNAVRVVSNPSAETLNYLLPPNYSDNNRSSTSPEIGNVTLHPLVFESQLDSTTNYNQGCHSSADVVDGGGVDGGGVDGGGVDGGGVDGGDVDGGGVDGGGVGLKREVCVGLIGITSLGIFPAEGWSFAFGHTSPSLEVAILSLAHFLPPFLDLGSWPKNLEKRIKRPSASNEIDHQFVCETPKTPHCRGEEAHERKNIFKRQKWDEGKLKNVLPSHFVENTNRKRTFSPHSTHSPHSPHSPDSTHSPHSSHSTHSPHSPHSRQSRQSSLSSPTQGHQADEIHARDRSFEGEIKWETSAMLAAKVALHEMGHILGLKHCEWGSTHTCRMSQCCDVEELRNSNHLLCSRCSSIFQRQFGHRVGRLLAQQVRVRM